MKDEMQNKQSTKFSQMLDSPNDGNAPNSDGMGPWFETWQGVKCKYMRVQDH